MAPLSPHHMSLLERVLSTDFVPLLPPLLDTSKPADQQRKKNLIPGVRGVCIIKALRNSAKGGLSIRC